MKLNRELVTDCDTEIGQKHLCKIFIRNIKLLSEDDSADIMNNLIFRREGYTVIEFLSLFISVVDKLK